MNNTEILLSNLKGLLTICVKMSDRQNMDTISFSKTRAKELLMEINGINKSISRAKSKHIRREPAWLTDPN